MNWRSGAAPTIDTVPLDRIATPHVERFPAGTIAIEEFATAGAGKVVFATTATGLRLLPTNDNHPIRWYLAQKCADGAVLIERAELNELHVVELKSKLTLEKWESSRRQLEGMLVNALALAGALSLAEPAAITCYVAFSEETVSKFISSSTIARKLPIGIRAASANPLVQACNDFVFRQLTLGDGEVVPLRLIARDQEGNADVDLR